MPTTLIRSFDDPLLDAYRDMKEKELARDGGRFIAESEQVVRRLLKSPIGVESVLVAERKQGIIAPLVGEHAMLLVAPDEIIAQTIGFEFHSGVMACGLRPQSPPVQTIIPPPPAPAIVTVCQEIANTENMGSLIRVSVAFGASAIILGERCCDPFFRQSVRVSMGAVFSLPIIRSTNLLKELDGLQEKWNFETIAAVVDEQAESLAKLKTHPRVAVVLGNEAQGLDPQTIAHCARRVTIPMKRGTDSLNVAIAAAVFLYQVSL